MGVVGAFMIGLVKAVIAEALVSAISAYEIVSCVLDLADVQGGEVGVTTQDTCSVLQVFAEPASQYIGESIGEYVSVGQAIDMEVSRTASGLVIASNLVPPVQVSSAGLRRAPVQALKIQDAPKPLATAFARALRSGEPRRLKRS